MLTSKQRAYLRGLANPIETILMIGKGEITDNIVKQADDALKARELIKGKVLENSSYSSREAAELIAENAVRKLCRLSVQSLFFIRKMKTSLKLYFLKTEENEQNRNTRRYF